MSNFRKFTEFCAGISVFAALMFVLRQYLEYNFKDVESTKEKLKILNRLNLHTSGLKIYTKGNLEFLKNHT